MVKNQWLPAGVLIGVVCLIVAGIMLSKNSFFEVCLGNGYRIKNVSRDIQTVSIRENGVDRRLIRGKITGYFSNDIMIVGLLDVTGGDRNGLVGLEGPLDRNGFFLVQVDTGQLMSGLNRSELAEQIKALSGVVELPTLREFDTIARLSCLSSS